MYNRTIESTIMQNVKNVVRRKKEEIVLIV
jgi:hypothetical protein